MMEIAQVKPLLRIGVRHPLWVRMPVVAVCRFLFVHLLGQLSTGFELSHLLGCDWHYLLGAGVDAIACGALVALNQSIAYGVDGSLEGNFCFCFCQLSLAGNSVD